MEYRALVYGWTRPVQHQLARHMLRQCILFPLLLSGFGHGHRVLPVEARPLCSAGTRLTAEGHTHWQGRAQGVLRHSAAHLRKLECCSKATTSLWATAMQHSRCCAVLICFALLLLLLGLLPSVSAGWKHSAAVVCQRAAVAACCCCCCTSPGLTMRPCNCRSHVKQSQWAWCYIALLDYSL